MPILNVKVSRPAGAELTMQISEALLELTTRILPCTSANASRRSRA